MDEKKGKFIFIGLDNAGKTSYLLSLENKYSQLYSLKPTKGFERREYNTLGFLIYVFDFGGQVIYRETFFKTPSNYLSTDLLYYVFDVQDRHRFGENIEFLQKIINVLDENQVQAEIFVCFHKSDPDLVSDPESYIHENLQIAQKLLKSRIHGREIQFFHTSIYDYSSLVGAFSAGLLKIIGNSTLVMETIYSDFLEKTGTNGICLLDQDALTIYEYYDQNPQTREIISTIGPNMVQSAEKLITYQIEHPHSIEIKMKGRCFFNVLELKGQKRFYLIIYARVIENYELFNILLENLTLTISNILKDMI